MKGSMTDKFMRSTVELSISCQIKCFIITVCNDAGFFLLILAMPRQRQDEVKASAVVLRERSWSCGVISLSKPSF